MCIKFISYLLKSLSYFADFGKLLAEAHFSLNYKIIPGLWITIISGCKSTVAQYGLPTMQRLPHIIVSLAIITIIAQFLLVSDKTELRSINIQHTLRGIYFTVYIIYAPL